VEEVAARKRGGWRGTRPTLVVTDAVVDAPLPGLAADPLHEGEGEDRDIISG